MSFDTIQLPSSVIADLYKQSLVVLNDVQPKDKKPVEKKNGHLPDIVLMKEEKGVAEPANKAEPQSATIQEPKVEPPLEVMQELNVPPQPAAKQEPEVVQPVIQFLGGFKQQVSVVISDMAHEHIQPDDLAFLEKMMAACKLTLADMAVINIANQPVAAQLWQNMPAKAVLLFDVTTSAVGIPFYQPDFKVQNWSGAKFMNAPALKAFRGPETPELKALKRELWSSLQKMFLEK